MCGTFLLHLVVCGTRVGFYLIIPIDSMSEVATFIIRQRQKREAITVIEVALLQARAKENQGAKHQDQADEYQDHYDIHASLLPLSR